jgi:hypothetical protein
MYRELRIDAAIKPATPANAKMPLLAAAKDTRIDIELTTANMSGNMFPCFNHDKESPRIEIVIEAIIRGNDTEWIIDNPAPAPESRPIVTGRLKQHK